MHARLSLGGNTKTVMFATVGPADYNYDETISTCRYANRAKNIKNKPKINEDPKDTMIREFQDEIARLKAQIETLKANSSSNNDNSAMAAQIESTVLNAISAHLSELADDEE